MSIDDRPTLTARLLSEQYKYTEDGMSISGQLSGIGLAGSQKFFAGFILSGDLQYLSGSPHYDGQLQSGDPLEASSRDSYYEVRGLIGRDDLILSPKAYVDWSLGMGYRALKNQIQDKAGYRREQSYQYLPALLGFNFSAMGLEFRAGAEYDIFLEGQNTTHLEDVSSELPPLHLKQHSGSGQRLSFSVQKKLKSMTLLARMDYTKWHVEDSEYKDVTLGDQTAWFYEPNNKTETTALSLGLSY